MTKIGEMQAAQQKSRPKAAVEFKAKAVDQAVNNADFKWLLDGHVSDVFKIAHAAANTNASNIFSFSNGAELTVDSTKTINTGNIDAVAAKEFGFETAAEYAGFYGQGGWFHYDITRRTALPNPDFSGWYVEGTYSLTGEEHAYDASTASFRACNPSIWSEEPSRSFSPGTVFPFFLAYQSQPSINFPESTRFCIT